MATYFRIVLGNIWSCIMGVPLFNINEIILQTSFGSFYIMLTVTHKRASYILASAHCCWPAIKPIIGARVIQFKLYGCRCCLTILFSCNALFAQRVFKTWTTKSSWMGRKKKRPNRHYAYEIKKKRFIYKFKMSRIIIKRRKEAVCQTRVMPTAISSVRICKWSRLFLGANLKAPMCARCRLHKIHLISLLAIVKHGCTSHNLVTLLWLGYYYRNYISFDVTWSLWFNQVCVCNWWLAFDVIYRSILAVRHGRVWKLLFRMQIRRTDARREFWTVLIDLRAIVVWFAFFDWMT